MNGNIPAHFELRDLSRMDFHDWEKDHMKMITGRYFSLFLTFLLVYIKLYTVRGFIMMLLYTNLMYFNNTLSHLGKEVELLMALHN
jgi:hypothetical protein